jgi:two-component system, NtrC family, response regulator AtoC
MSKVLVADDDEGVRSFMAEALRRDGHRVTEVDDGARAQRVLETEGFEVLLTDLKMPKLDGLALLRWAKAQQPELEVIVLTGHGEVSTAVDAMKAGAFEYLQKPIEGPQELRLLVRRALERQRLLRLEAVPTLAVQPVEWKSASMRQVTVSARKVAATNATVLVLGPSGSGKEVIARAIHEWSDRSRGPFIAVNCAAMHEGLLESELFGHEKGAFTGATAQRRGRLELANDGTFFLDEVAELHPRLQAKLLRVLEVRTFERVGSARTLETNARFIAATHRDLPSMISSGSFREDLFHRLAVFPLSLPALDARKEDLPMLVDVLIPHIARELNRPRLRLAVEVIPFLLNQFWPGNVRQLKNALERAAIVSNSDELRIGDFDGASASSVAAPRAVLPTVELEVLERAAIVQALELTSGNRKLAAEALGIGLRTLYEKLKRHQLHDPHSD